jgi:anti-sigma-K factor RskA
MIDESKEDLIVQYLLGELGPTEAEQFRKELEADVELRKHVDEVRETFASIAHSVKAVEPAPELLEKILRQARQPIQHTSAPPTLQRRWFNAVPWALAACFAVACLVLGVERARMQKELSSYRHRDELAEIKIATLKAQVAAYEQSTAVIVWDRKRKIGVLQLDRFPPAEEGKDYQLWVIDSKGPVSAGIISVRGTGLTRTAFHPTGPIDVASKFAISIEKAGGAPQPEGKIVLVGQ